MCPGCDVSTSLCVLCFMCPQPVSTTRGVPGFDESTGSYLPTLMYENLLKGSCLYNWQLTAVSALWLKHKRLSPLSLLTPIPFEEASHGSPPMSCYDNCLLIHSVMEASACNRNVYKSQFAFEALKFCWALQTALFSYPWNPRSLSDYGKKNCFSFSVSCSDASWSVSYIWYYSVCLFSRAMMLENQLLEHGTKQVREHPPCFNFVWMIVHELADSDLSIDMQYDFFFFLQN